MIIITEPNVHVLSAPVFYPHPEYELPDIPVFASYVEYDGYRLIAHAGKGCYDSYGKDGRSIEQHIKTLTSTRHGSVFEHLHVSLFISGISRGCSHEIVRHRHFNYSQRSTRYTNEEDAVIILDPYYSMLYEKAWRAHKYNEPSPTVLESDLLNWFINGCENSLQLYGVTVEALIKEAPPEKTKVEKRKWARGKARQLLPHALETRMTMTGNIRAWRWFIEERSSRHAEPEIRRLSNHIFDHLRGLYPLLFEDYKLEVVDDFFEYTTEFRKI